MSGRPDYLPPRERIEGIVAHAKVSPQTWCLEEQADLLEGEFHFAVERALANLAKPRADAPLNQRLFDLVRHQRHDLHDAGLITDEELADLITAGSSSARRLEDYDRVRARIAALQSEITARDEAERSRP